LISPVCSTGSPLHLPNEVLQYIFDQAYTYSYTGALIAKRFLPFYESTLYRNIRIENPARLSCLLRTLTDRPALSLHTQSVEFELDANFTDMDPLNLVHLIRLLSFLPNLRDLSSSCYVQPTSVDIPQSLVRGLKSVTVPVSVGEDLEVEPRIVDWIAAMPSIEDVHLTRWCIFDNANEWVTWRMPHVKKLDIEGFGVTDPEISTVINGCTSLESLSLWSTPGADNLDISFEEVLPLLKPVFKSLTSLYLLSADRNVSIGESLASFPRLLHLELQGLIPLLEFESALMHLESLTHLALSTLTDYDWDDLVPVLHGPGRLPHLTKLGLGSFFDNVIGQRFDPSNPIHVLQFEEGTYDDWQGWSVPQIEYTPMSYWRQLVQIATIARASGILVAKSFDQGIEIVKAFLLETNNLAIARAYYQMDLHGIPRARKLARDFGLELPELDFSCPCPDGDDTELIKVDMEGTGWFALTLKDKMEKDADDEEEEGEKE